MAGQAGLAGLELLKNVLSRQYRYRDSARYQDLLLGTAQPEHQLSESPGRVRARAGRAGPGAGPAGKSRLGIS